MKGAASERAAQGYDCRADRGKPDHLDTGVDRRATAGTGRRADRRQLLLRRAPARVLVLLRAAKAPPPNQPAPQAPSATAQLDAITATLREPRDHRTQPRKRDPAYIRFQREQLDRASLFSDVWQRAIWQDPELDYTLERPVGTLAKRQWQDARAAERDTVMAHLSERYGLFYYFAQDLRGLRGDGPIVKSVADRWHLTVRAISTDGGPSRHFPNYTVESGQRPRMGIEPESRRRWCCGTARPSDRSRSDMGSCQPMSCRIASFS